MYGTFISLLSLSVICGCFCACVSAMDTRDAGLMLSYLFILCIMY